MRPPAETGKGLGLGLRSRLGFLKNAHPNNEEFRVLSINEKRRIHQGNEMKIPLCLNIISIFSLSLMLLQSISRTQIRLSVILRARTATCKIHIVT